MAEFGGLSSVVRLCRFLGRRLVGFLADHVGQALELAQAGHAVFQIVPEANAQFATGFLQAGEGVSATPTRGAPCAAADLATLDELADVRLLGVVVQRNLRMLQHTQQVGLHRTHRLEHLIEVGIAGALIDQGVETGCQDRLLSRVGIQLVRLQSLVQLPNLSANRLQDGPMLVVVRHHLEQGTFRVNPTGGMQQDDELQRPIAEHLQIRRYATVDEATQKRPFGGDAHVSFAADAQPG
jgi:hypothetical protein